MAPENRIRRRDRGPSAVRSRRARRAASWLLVLGTWLCWPTHSLAVIITVNSNTDGPVNLTDATVTLRDAINAANNDVMVAPAGPTGAGADEIRFAPNLVGATITLTQGQLDVTESLTIQGPVAGAPDQLTISGGNATRLFNVGGAGAQTFDFNDVTLADGNSQPSPNENRGGAAILMFGQADDTTNVNRSVLRDNQTGNRVGTAISLVRGTLNVTQSAIVNHLGGQGTVYSQDATASLTSSTLSGNTSVFGAIWARSGLTTNLDLLNVTLANNNVGVFFSAELAGATTNVQYRNSIFSGNTPNFQAGGMAGTINITSLGSNILSDATGDPTPAASDQINTNAQITALVPASGSFIHKLLLISPAIDQADATAPPTDQIGTPRNDGDLNASVLPDIGAAELTTGAIEVVKALVPATDPGLFNLQIDGTTAGTGANVGDAGTTGEQRVITGAHTVGETAGTGTHLVDYDTIIECRDGDGAGAVVAGPANGAGPLNVTVSQDDDIVCTVTNTRVLRSPSLSLAEKAGYALIEQGLSIIAGIVDHTTCALTAGSYPFSVSVAASGVGSATIDDLGIQSTDNTPAGQSFRGHQIRTEITTPGEVDDTTVSAPAVAAPRVGDFLFSRGGDVMVGQADYLLDGPNNAYDEHIVKDFFLGPVFGGTDARGVRDEGLEVITKLDFPRAKWRQLSQYRRPNGGVGRLSITKELIAPDGFAVCGISLLDALIDNAGDGFQLQGNVSVQSAVPPALP